jgi:three-Cys-motif partner protein
VAPITQPDLFQVGPRLKAKRTSRATHPYWTENKAKLIRRYLYQFLMVTRHGIYLDGFAGPQEEDGGAENWSAKLVLELTPRWLNRFILIEQNPEQVERIKQMLKALPKTPLGRKMPKIFVKEGDVNDVLPRYLADFPIASTKATFCLLDQRTFECHWATVRTVAKHKRHGHKIEIFYFLANSWLDRAFGTTKDAAKIEAWWGRSDWQRVACMKGWDRATAFAERFEKELGYRSVIPYPIYKRKGGRAIMYFMIHATDHPDAADLMGRSYDSSVAPLETEEQIELFLSHARAARQAHRQ